jgi:transglutaminase-like putative cysteine protease
MPEVLGPGSVDPRSVDWTAVAETSYVIHRHMHYEYPAPIDDLQHHLVVFPPRSHGDQQRLSYRLDVSNAKHEVRTRRDGFGNTVVGLSVPRVEQSIDFDAWMAVRRRNDAGPHRVRGALLQSRGLLEPSPLTLPDHSLREVAANLRRTEDDPLLLATRICNWVHQAMSYERGVTGVRTTAAEALALGRGVCQDYAHVMIALCRLCDLPARYVSGHLLGEGPMHAWVEVLLPSSDPGEGVACPFDPTHDRTVSLRYVTVAVGRDFGDVSPTRGTFRAARGGWLSSRQFVSLIAVQIRLI